MRDQWKWLLSGFLSLSLSACDTGDHFAPVMDINTIEPIPKTGVHHTKSGETLYEVAWRYGLDYRSLAKRNQLPKPYAIKTGQALYLRGHQKVNLVNHEPMKTNWIWPAQGKIVASFSNSHKGINIAGYPGEPVYAAQAGKIVYCGNGLRGYGNLIIIKHNSLYLSAYAYNRAVFVKEGDWVEQGQKIAEMGKAGKNKIILHFEIRRAGQPIDPLSLLSRSDSIKL